MPVRCITVLVFSQTETLLVKSQDSCQQVQSGEIWGNWRVAQLSLCMRPSWAKSAAVICWGKISAVAAASRYAKASKSTCAPTSGREDSWLATGATFAAEGVIFVLMCNPIHRREAIFPPDIVQIYGGESRRTSLPRGSCIVRTVWNLLAGPNTESEGVLVARRAPGTKLCAANTIWNPSSAIRPSRIFQTSRRRTTQRTSHPKLHARMLLPISHSADFDTPKTV